jgi:hypothetical protein
LRHKCSPGCRRHPETAGASKREHCRPRLDHAALPEFIESTIAALPVAAATPTETPARQSSGQPGGNRPVRLAALVEGLLVQAVPG